MFFFFFCILFSDGQSGAAIRGNMGKAQEKKHKTKFIILIGPRDMYTLKGHMTKHWGGQEAENRGQGKV